MANSIVLKYPGKEKETKLFHRPSGFALEKEASFGQKRLDGWNKMLILGDNLDIWRLLLHEKEIKEKVRLIYIDPPFATNQEFKAGNSRTATISHSQDDKTPTKTNW